MWIRFTSCKTWSNPSALLSVFADAARTLTRFGYHPRRTWTIQRAAAGIHPHHRFVKARSLAPSSRPGLIHSSLYTSPSPPLLQCLHIKTSCYNQSCLLEGFFYGIFMSFPGAADVISSQSNGTSASLSGLSLGEAALQKCVHASPTETPFFMSFTSKEVIMVLK